MQLKELAKMLGIESYPDTLEEIYKSLPEDPGSLCDKEYICQLEEKYGLVGYGVEGEEFNPDEHEAIGRCEDENAKTETLKQVYLKGYKLKQKVIRHAKVMVNVPKQ